MKNLCFIFLVFNSILSCDLKTNMHKVNQHKIKKTKRDFADRQKALLALRKLEIEIRKKRFIRMALNSAAFTHFQRPSRDTAINFLKVGLKRNLELLTSEYKKKNLEFFPDFTITYQFQLADGIPVSIIGPKIDIEALRQEVRFETHTMHQELEAIALSLREVEIDSETAGPAE